MSGLEELNRAMLEAGFFPEKKYSQNFLVDKKVVNELVASAHLKKSDSVLEIGGGTGVVTQKLIESGAHVTTVELQEGLVRYLKKRFTPHKNIRVIRGDFLQLDLKTIRFNKVVASPPYAISDDIMFKLFEHEFDWASLVWQLEFAEKILAPPGSSEYHPLSVIGQYWYEGTLLCKISPKAFYPIPNHFSAILGLKRKKKTKNVPHFSSFVSLVRTLFRFKNKTALNAGKQLEKNPVKGIENKKFFESLKALNGGNEKIFLLEPVDFVDLFLGAVE